MKLFARRLITLKLIVAALTLMPLYLKAQDKLMGELVVTKISAEGFVTVNGERASSGRSISAASEIQTSAQASAKVLIPQTGTVLVAPASRLNLSFVSASISGDLTAGEITVETAPNTSFNFLTPDGAVTLPAAAQSNVFKVSVANGKTRIQTLTGQVKFNNVVVAAGEFYPPSDDNGSGAAGRQTSSRGVNPLLVVGILGAVGAVVIIALTSSSGGSNDVPVLSPTR